jgi:hypothetical protein
MSVYDKLPTVGRYNDLNDVATSWDIGPLMLRNVSRFVGKRRLTRQNGKEHEKRAANVHLVASPFGLVI